MWQQFLMGGLGLVSGFIIASGTVAFIISLGVVPRYAGITRTADKVMLYENCCIFNVFFRRFNTKLFVDLQFRTDRN